jgi:hypothetical protein
MAPDWPVPQQLLLLLYVLGHPLQRRDTLRRILDLQKHSELLRQKAR